MQAQLIALQERVAYQDRTIEQLDAVVREFTARIERLEEQVQTLQSVVEGLRPMGPQDEAPPHYA